MDFHTDQSLDLKEDSYICLFSCYENGNETNETNTLRKLKILNKKTNELSEIALKNNSAVLFSTSTNHKFQHKIILESDKSINRWLGITFRLSKTFVKFINNKPYINDSDISFKMASDDEKKAFYKQRGKENSNIEHTYPDINYTISKSDLMDII